MLIGADWLQLAGTHAQESIVRAFSESLQLLHAVSDPACSSLLCQESVFLRNWWPNTSGIKLPLPIANANSGKLTTQWSLIVHKATHATVGAN